jgi:hypothetical protein
VKKLIVKLLPVCCLIFLAGACQSKKELLLKSPSDQKLYSIKADDATEVEVLKQQFKLDVVLVENNEVYFHATNEALLKQLTDMGYAAPAQHAPDDVYSLFGKVTGTYSEEEIIKSGVSVVNREKDYVIVYGSISKLKALKARGYNLLTPDTEIRPREIEVGVNSQPDIQKLYNLGVDIFTAVKDSTGKEGFIIHGSAFDRQIDSIKKMNFRVTILRPKI